MKAVVLWYVLQDHHSDVAEENPRLRELKEVPVSRPVLAVPRRSRRRESQIKGIERKEDRRVAYRAGPSVAEENPRLRELKVGKTRLVDRGLSVGSQKRIPD